MRSRDVYRAAKKRAIQEIDDASLKEAIQRRASNAGAIGERNCKLNKRLTCNTSKPFAYTKSSHAPVNFVFGEIDFDDFQRLLRIVNIGRDDVYVDLGCGTGNTLAAAALLGIQNISFTNDKNDPLLPPAVTPVAIKEGDEAERAEQVERVKGTIKTKEEETTLNTASTVCSGSRPSRPIRKAVGIELMKSKYTECKTMLKHLQGLMLSINNAYPLVCLESINDAAMESENESCFISDEHLIASTITRRNSSDGVIDIDSSRQNGTTSHLSQSRYSSRLGSETMISNGISSSLNKELEAELGVELELVEGDFTNVDWWSNADVVYTCATCFTTEMMQQLQPLFALLKRGSRIITLDKKLPINTTSTSTTNAVIYDGINDSPSTAPAHTAVATSLSPSPVILLARQIGEEKCTASWGEAVAYLYEKL